MIFVYIWKRNKTKQKPTQLNWNEPELIETNDSYLFLSIHINARNGQQMASHAVRQIENRRCFDNWSFTRSQDIDYRL